MAEGIIITLRLVDLMTFEKSLDYLSKFPMFKCLSFRETRKPRWATRRSSHHRCSMEKRRKIHRKTPAPEFLF